MIWAVIKAFGVFFAVFIVSAMLISENVGMVTGIVAGLAALIFFAGGVGKRAAQVMNLKDEVVEKVGDEYKRYRRGN